MTEASKFKVTFNCIKCSKFFIESNKPVSIGCEKEHIFCQNCFNDLSIDQDKKIYCIQCAKSSKFEKATLDHLLYQVICEINAKVDEVNSKNEKRMLKQIQSNRETERKIEVITAELMQAKAKQKPLQEEITALKKESSELKRENSELKIKLLQFSKEEIYRKGEFAILQQNIASLNQENSNYKQQLQSLRSAFDKVLTDNNEVKQLRNQLQSQRRLLEKQKKKTQKLTHQITEKDKRLSIFAPLTNQLVLSSFQSFLKAAMSKQDSLCSSSDNDEFDHPAQSQSKQSKQVSSQGKLSQPMQNISSNIVEAHKSADSVKEVESRSIQHQEECSNQRPINKDEEEERKKCEDQAQKQRAEAFFTLLEQSAIEQIEYKEETKIIERMEKVEEKIQKKQQPSQQKILVPTSTSTALNPTEHSQNSSNSSATKQKNIQARSKQESHQDKATSKNLVGKKQANFPSREQKERNGSEPNLSFNNSIRASIDNKLTVIEPRKPYQNYVQSMFQDEFFAGQQIYDPRYTDFYEQHFYPQQYQPHHQYPAQHPSQYQHQQSTYPGQLQYPANFDYNYGQQSQLYKQNTFYNQSPANQALSPNYLQKGLHKQRPNQTFSQGRYKQIPPTNFYGQFEYNDEYWQHISHIQQSQQNYPARTLSEFAQNKKLRQMVESDSIMRQLKDMDKNKRFTENELFMISNLEKKKAHASYKFQLLSKLKKLQDNRFFPFYNQLIKFTLETIKEISLTRLNIDKMIDIKEVIALQKLNLSYNNIRKIEGFEQNVHIRTLILNNNQIDRIQNMGKLRQLNSIAIHFNNLKKESAEVLRLSSYDKMQSLSISFLTVSGADNLNCLRVILSKSWPNLQYIYWGKVDDSLTEAFQNLIKNYNHNHKRTKERKLSLIFYL